MVHWYARSIIGGRSLVLSVMEAIVDSLEIQGFMSMYRSLWIGYEGL